MAIARDRAIDRTHAVEPTTRRRRSPELPDAFDPDKPVTPYMKKLLETNETVKAERNLAARGRWKKIDPVGITAYEIMAQLVMLGGIASRGRICRETCMKNVAVRSYELVLQDAGLVFVHTEKGPKGHLVVKIEITDAGRNVVG